MTWNTCQVNFTLARKVNNILEVKNAKSIANDWVKQSVGVLVIINDYTISEPIKRRKKINLLMGVNVHLGRHFLFIEPKQYGIFLV